MMTIMVITLMMIIMTTLMTIIMTIMLTTLMMIIMTTMVTDKLTTLIMIIMLTTLMMITMTTVVTDRQYMSAIFYHNEEQKREAEASLASRLKFGQVQLVSWKTTRAVFAIFCPKFSGRR